MEKNRYYSQTWGTKLFDVLVTVFMAIFMIIVVYPFWNQLMISIADTTAQPVSEVILWPKSLTLNAYNLLFQDNKIYSGLLISLLRVIVGTCCTLFCTGLLAYVTTVRRFKGRTLLRRAFIFTMYFGGGLIPTYLLMIQLHLVNSFWVYILPGFFSSYYMLLIASYISNLPEALFDAARIDGAGEFRIYLKIILPICIPVFAAISVYLAVGHWNSWFDVTLYNPKGNWDTMQVYLRRLLLQAESFKKINEQALAESKFRNLSSQSLKAATTMVVTLPILLVYPFFQRFFISGITIGAVKG